MTRDTTPRMTTAAGFLVVLGLTTLLLFQPTQAQKPIGPQPAQLKPEGGDRPGPAGPAKSVAELTEEVRQLKEQIEELRRQNYAILSHVMAVPNTAPQHEDYAQARRQFQTKLVRKGPSPQSAPPIKPPAGVDEIEYASSALRLKAWINRPADEKIERPAVLFLHGGLPSAWETGSRRSPIAMRGSWSWPPC